MYENGLIRVGGRLRQSFLEFGALNSSSSIKGRHYNKSDCKMMSRKGSS